MAQVYRYSLAEVGIAVGGNVLTEGGGDGEFCTITSPQRAGSKGGVHGDAVLFDTPNQIYEVSITLLETSSANRILQSLYNAQVDRTTTGTLDFMFENSGTGATLSGQCLITKEPDHQISAEAQNRVWQLHVASGTPVAYSDRTVIV